MANEKKNSTARIQANNRYNAKAYDRLNIAIPKGRKEDVEEHARSKGETVNSLVNALLRADMGIEDSSWKKQQPEEHNPSGG